MHIHTISYSSVSVVEVAHARVHVPVRDTTERKQRGTEEQNNVFLIKDVFIYSDKIYTFF